MPPCPQTVEADGTTCFQMSDVNAWMIDLRRRVAGIVPSIGYGRCYVCNLPWYIVTGHDIYYANGSSCFPVCESCWQQMSHREALTHYYAWVDRYYHGNPEYKQRLLDEVFPPGQISIDLA